MAKPKAGRSGRFVPGNQAGVGHGRPPNNATELRKANLPNCVVILKFFYDAALDETNTINQRMTAGKTFLDFLLPRPIEQTSEGEAGTGLAALLDEVRKAKQAPPTPPPTPPTPPPAEVKPSER